METEVQGIAGTAKKYTYINEMYSGMLFYNWL